VASAAGSTVSFPWGESIPCNTTGGPAGMNVGVFGQAGDALVKNGDSITIGGNPALDGATPRWTLKYLGTPNSGAGTTASPFAVSFSQLLIGYEHSDQQQSLLLARTGMPALTLQAQRTYRVLYSLSTGAP
jgi:hypothetical protein